MRRNFALWLEAPGTTRCRRDCRLPGALARRLSLAKKPAKFCLPTKNYLVRKSTDVKTRASTLEIAGNKIGSRPRISPNQKTTGRFWYLLMVYKQGKSPNCT